MTVLGTLTSLLRELFDSPESKRAKFIAEYVETKFAVEAADANPLLYPTDEAAELRNKLLLLSQESERLSLRWHCLNAYVDVKKARGEWTPTPAIVYYPARTGKIPARKRY